MTLAVQFGCIRSAHEVGEWKPGQVLGYVNEGSPVTMQRFPRRPRAKREALSDLEIAIAPHSFPLFLSLSSANNV